MNSFGRLEMEMVLTLCSPFVTSKKVIAKTWLLVTTREEALRLPGWYELQEALGGHGWRGSTRLRPNLRVGGRVAEVCNVALIAVRGGGRCPDGRDGTWQTSLGVPT